MPVGLIVLAVGIMMAIAFGVGLLTWAPQRPRPGPSGTDGPANSEMAPSSKLPLGVASAHRTLGIQRGRKR